MRFPAKENKADGLIYKMYIETIKKHVQTEMNLLMHSDTRLGFFRIDDYVQVNLFEDTDKFPLVMDLDNEQINRNDNLCMINNWFTNTSSIVDPKTLIFLGKRSSY